MRTNCHSILTVHCVHDMYNIVIILVCMYNTENGLSNCVPLYMSDTLNVSLYIDSGFYLTVLFLGGGFSITVYVFHMHVRHNCNFDVCIVAGFLSNDPGGGGGG